VYCGHLHEFNIKYDIIVMDYMDILFRNSIAIAGISYGYEVKRMGNRENARLAGSRSL
jgi:hypothetical protein